MKRVILVSLLFWNVVLNAGFHEGLIVDDSVRALIGPTEGLQMLSIDELSAVSEIAAGEALPRRLHIVGHGEPGLISIGGEGYDVVHLSSLLRAATEKGVEEIVLWSCRFGEDRNAVERLAAATGVAVYATDTELRGGPGALDRWELTSSSGQLYEGFVPFDPTLIASWGVEWDLSSMVEFGLGLGYRF